MLALSCRTVARQLWSYGAQNTATIEIGARYLSFATNEHEQLRDSVRKVVENEINPRLDEWEEKV